MLHTVNHSDTVVDRPAVPGVAVVDPNSPLARLSYFNGKYLLAEDLSLDQEAQRRLVFASNRAFGAGVAHGLVASLDRTDGTLHITTGVAIDRLGRVISLTQDRAIDVPALIEASTITASAVASSSGSDASAEFSPCAVSTAVPVYTVFGGLEVYEITVGHLDARCGTENVFGQVCQDACVSGTERSRLIDAVLVRARQLPLALPNLTFPVERKHLRSRVAAAYFAAEAKVTPPLTLSADLLYREEWCGGTPLLAPSLDVGGENVAIGLLVRFGGQTEFVDAWAARRERIEPWPSAYWDGRTGRRPMATFNAQVAQFQCQLRDALPRDALAKYFAPPSGGATAGGTLTVFGSVIDQMEKNRVAFKLDDAQLAAVRDYFAKLPPTLSTEVGGSVGAASSASATPVGRRRLMVDSGIVELPPVGYLPLVASVVLTQPERIDVERQVGDLLGPGVVLAYRAVRTDEVPGELLEAQHRDRISLVEGITDPSRRPEVEVLVPGATFAAGPPIEVRWNTGASITVATSGSDKTPFFRVDAPLDSRLHEFLTSPPAPAPSLVAPKLGGIYNFRLNPTATGVTRSEPFAAGGKRVRFFGTYRASPFMIVGAHGFPTTPVHLRLDWAADPFGLARAESLEFGGEFAVIQSSGIGFNTLVVTNGVAASESQNPADLRLRCTAQMRDERSTPIELAFLLTSAAGKLAGQLRLTVSEVSIGGAVLTETFEIDVDAVPPSTDVSVSLRRIGADGGRTSSVSVTFESDPPVEKVDNPSRLAALTAANSFAVDRPARGYRQLFDALVAPPPPSGPPVLVAKADWVAFRRLESNQPVPPPFVINIEAPEQPPAPVDGPDAFVQVWKVTPTSPEAFAATELGLRTGGSPAAATAELLGAVRFHAKDAAVVSGTDQVVTQWRRAGTPQLWQLAFARAGTRDGDLEIERLKVILDSLAGAVGAPQGIDLQTPLASGFSIDSSSGAVVMLTNAPVPPVVRRAEVWAIDVDKDQMKEAFAFLVRAANNSGAVQQNALRSAHKFLDNIGGPIIRGMFSVVDGRVDRSGIQAFLAECRSAMYHRGHAEIVSFYVDDTLAPPQLDVMKAFTEALGAEDPEFVGGPDPAKIPDLALLPGAGVPGRFYVPIQLG